MIVVGVDGSSSALDAVRWAAQEAVPRGLPLRLVTSYQLTVGPAGVLDPELSTWCVSRDGVGWQKRGTWPPRPVCVVPVDGSCWKHAWTEEEVMARKHWRDLTPGQRWAFVAMSAVEVGLAAVAWNDLAHRPQEAVNGRKPLWALAIAVNFVGPIAYLRYGRRKTAG